MPGSKRQRTDLKTSIQQRQEQQRDRPASTAKTSGGGIGGQQSGSTGPQPVHLRLEPTLAPLPRHGEPLTPAQEAALELMTDLARDLAIHAHHSHLDELIRRIPELGTACGRAVANALREAQ